VKRLLPLIAAALLLAALPSAASASATQESMFQDDPLLVYGAPAEVDSTLDTIASLGVDRIRISVFWANVAPANDQLQKPSFDATDPAAYPASGWAPYDHLIKDALARGILVDLDITSPVPRWAASAAPSDRQDLQKNWGPNPVEFGEFVKAVGTRYSGSYMGLPRVDYWSIWNEPNQAGWLTPQWSPDPRNAKREVESSPAVYRSLVDAAWQGLADSGHGTDTILIGETAPQGQGKGKGITQSIDALRFIRQMYCLDSNLNLIKGSSATVRNCPDNVATFVAQNPGLFHATGWAHHPYDLVSPPGLKPSNPDWVTMANLPDLSRELRRIYERYGQKLPTTRGVPLYLTEYGYQTRPDPFAAATFSQQAAYLDQAEYIASRNKDVRALSQFLLVDDAPDPRYKTTGPQASLAWRTFQSGLELLSGKHKPAYRAYVTPLFLKRVRVRHGSAVPLFGMLRPAPPTSRPKVSIQWRSKHGTVWHTRKRVGVAGPRHYFNTSVVAPATGYIRLRWIDAGRALASRAAAVTVTH
jgi:hypothetical protein